MAADPKVRVIALQQHTYDNQVRKTGEVYEAQAGLVIRMVAAGFVKIVDSDKPKREYKRRDMKPEE